MRPGRAYPRSRLGPTGSISVGHSLNRWLVEGLCRRSRPSPQQSGRGSSSSCLSQRPIWFQLVNVWVTRSVLGDGAAFSIDCGAYPCLPHGSLERRLARKESSWRVARLPRYDSSCRRGSTFSFVPLVHPPKNREVDWNLASAGMTAPGRRCVHRSNAEPSYYEDIP